MAVTKSFIPPTSVVDTFHFPSLDLTNVGALSMATDIMQLKKDMNSLKENKKTEQSILKKIQNLLQTIHSSFNWMNIRNKTNLFHYILIKTITINLLVHQ